MIYRIKQVISTIFGKLTEDDIQTIESILDSKELQAFQRLTDEDQYHSWQVAVTAAEIAKKENINLSEKQIMKAGLLHDIGKAGFKLSLLDRIAPVIITKFWPKLSLSLSYKKNRLWQGFYVYWHHGKIGAKLAFTLGLSSDLINLIKNHTEAIKRKDTKLIKLIKKSDDLN